MELGAAVPSRLNSSRWVSACQRPYSGEVISGSGSSAISGTMGCRDARGARRDPAGRIGVGRCLGRIVVGQIDELGQRCLKRVGVRLVPVLVSVARGLVGVAEVGIGNFQRSAQAQDAIQSGFVDARKIRAWILDIEVARAHRGIDRLRLEQADQIAEVAAIAGGELQR